MGVAQRPSVSTARMSSLMRSAGCVRRKRLTLRKIKRTGMLPNSGSGPAPRDPDILLCLQVWLRDEKLPQRSVATASVADIRIYSSALDRHLGGESVQGFPLGCLPGQCLRCLTVILNTALRAGGGAHIDANSLDPVFVPPHQVQRIAQAASWTAHAT